MFSLTHSRAATWSSSPRLAYSSPRYRSPSAPTRQLMATHTTPSRAKRLPSSGADDWIWVVWKWQIFSETGLFSSPIAGPPLGRLTVRLNEAEQPTGSVVFDPTSRRAAYIGLAA